MNDRDRPTLALIAAELGVSTASVSNALRRPERVSAALRARVLSVATRVGYAGPQAAAQMLPKGRADAIGLVFTSSLPAAFADPAAVAFLQGLSASCESADLALVLVPAGELHPDASINGVANVVVDGFVVYSLRDNDPLLDAVRARRLPVVVVDAPTDVPGTDSVGVDDRAATAQLGGHLAELGHRSVGIVAPQLGRTRLNGRVGPSRWSTSAYALMRHRLDGLHEGLGLDPGRSTVEERSASSTAAGAHACHALLDDDPGITAICCLTDVLALGALAAAKQRGLTVPGDLSITGYDDLPEAERAGLTTVAQPHVDKGRVAGDLMLTAAGRTSDRRRTLPTTLEVRASSGPASVTGHGS